MKKDMKGKEQGKIKNNRGNTYIGIQLCYTYLGNPFRKHNDMVYVGIQPNLVTLKASVYFESTWASSLLLTMQLEHHQLMFVYAPCCLFD